MKLRLETGNFNIVLDSEGKAYLPKGLTCEDLVGVVITNPFFEGNVNPTNYVGVVNNVIVDSGYICLFSGQNSFSYYPETGVLTLG